MKILEHVLRFYVSVVFLFDPRFLFDAPDHRLVDQTPPKVTFWASNVPLDRTSYVFPWRFRRSQRVLGGSYIGQNSIRK